MNKIAFALAVILLIGTHAPVVAFDKPTVSHDGWNFEISNPWGHKKHNYSIVSSEDGHPVRFGKFSERFEVRPGDCGVTENGGWNDCENDRERSEMSSHKDVKYYNGDEYWYRQSIFFPKNYDAMHPVHMTFGQFKQVGCHPVFSFNTKEASRYDPKFGLYMTSKYSEEQNVMRFNPLNQYNYRNKWHDIVVHAKWSYSNDGWLKVWHNGKQKVNYKGKTIWCHDGIYFKYGVYKTGISRIAEKLNKTTIVYYDGIRISRTGEGMFDSLAE